MSARWRESPKETANVEVIVAGLLGLVFLAGFALGWAVAVWFG